MPAIRLRQKLLLKLRSDALQTAAALHKATGRSTRIDSVQRALRAMLKSELVRNETSVDEDGKEIEGWVLAGEGIHMRQNLARNTRRQRGRR